MNDMKLGDLVIVRNHGCLGIILEIWEAGIERRWAAKVFLPNPPSGWEHIYVWLFDDLRLILEDKNVIQT